MIGHADFGLASTAAGAVSPPTLVGHAGGLDRPGFARRPGPHASGSDVPLVCSLSAPCCCRQSPRSLALTLTLTLVLTTSDSSERRAHLHPPPHSRPPRPCCLAPPSLPNKPQPHHPSRPSLPGRSTLVRLTLTSSHQTASAPSGESRPGPHRQAAHRLRYLCWLDSIRPSIHPSFPFLTRPGHILSLLLSLSPRLRLPAPAHI